MSEQKLKPTLGLWTSISLVVGGIIGSGIFMKPAIMATQLGSPELLVGIWVLAGVVTLFGALSNAEVAAMIPETGGQFIFFRHMYGEFVAFLYGWAAFAVFNTAGNASIAYVLGTYIEYFITLPHFPVETEHSISFHIPLIGTFFPLENIGVKGATIFIVMLLTMINYRSTKFGGNIQVVFTFLKVAAIAIIVMGLLSSGKGTIHNFVNDSDTNHLTGWLGLGGIAAAMSGAFWGYDGWNNITFVAGEIDNPQKNIPKSLLFGILACIGVYALITLGYLYVLPIDSIANSKLVAAQAAEVVFGAAGGGLIAAIVIVSTFGTTNGNILATARVSFAMAQDKNFFDWVGKVHPRYNTPGNALVFQGIYTSLLVLSGSFDMLTDMLIFVSWLFYGLSAVGLFVLRYKMPDAERPYRVWGYPFVPAIFIAFTAIFLIITLATDIAQYANGQTPLINSLFGLLLAALGVPLYWYFSRKQKQR
jgi:APA family basic amino acid/polyamine antiporter